MRQSQTFFAQNLPTLYRIAMLMCGNTAIAEERTAQALRGTEQSAPLIPAASLLLRLFTMQGTDPNPCDFPENSPLLALIRLPESSRGLCALQLCGCSESDCADILDCTLAELSQKQEKLKRRMAFSTDSAMEMNALQEAADAIALSADAQLRIAEAAKNHPSSETIHKIELRQSGMVKEVALNEKPIFSDARKPIHETKNSIQMPRWALSVCIAVPLLSVCICTAILLIKLHPTTESNPSVNDLIHISTTPEGEVLIESPYLSFTQAREKALQSAAVSEQDAAFIKTKLNPESEPVTYELTFLDDKGSQYEYLLDAENGEVIDSAVSKTKTVLNTRDFLPPDTVRQMALECAGLSDAIFTKEKLDNENDIYYYKIEFNDADGREYQVQLLASTGALLKYTVKDAPELHITDAIPLEEAKTQALLRAGGLSEEQVTFTKAKLDGSVYLLAFTLEDGTQYTIELDAKTGLANTVDVVLVSTDTSRFIGFAKAKQLALEKAGLSADTPVFYSKAKIDRDNAAYVYELEFETAAYSYEVRLNTNTGEILKFQAWFQ